MNIKNEKDVIELIEQDEWMMTVLKAAKLLHLPDWWICAGFVRSKVWDTLHSFSQRTNTPDVDVIYFDDTSIDELEEKRFEEKLKNILPNVPWSVKNEARMHILNDVSPYFSSIDAISKFPETATALGVRLDDKDNVILTAPCGISDVISCVVKPTPHFAESKVLAVIYEERILKKNWKSIWNRVIVHHT